MQRMMMVAAGAVLIGMGYGAPARVQPQDGGGTYYATVPPASWMPADTADSLYRLARQALNRGRYAQAAEQFRAIHARYPDSEYAADALYWEAFALHRMRGQQNLRRALAALDEQASRYPNAATRGDANALRSRVNADLARLGDAAAATEVAVVAAEAAEAPAPPVAGTPPTAAAVAVPRPGRTPRPPREPRAPKAYGPGDCDNEDDSRIFAIQALMNSNRERAVPLLRKVLERRDSASVCLRRFAMMVAAQQGDDAADLLITSARQDPDPEVRKQAIFWLSQTKDPRVLPILDSVMRTSDDDELRQSAVFALSQQRSPEARRMLRSYAEREDIPDEARVQALFFIAQGNTAEDMAYLRSVYGKMKSKESKQQVMAAMMANRSRENAQWLIGIARDRNEDIEIRKQALFFAGMSEATTADLLQVYNSLPNDPELRQHMVVVLGQRANHDPEAVGHLVEIVRKEKDPELRRTAMFWLSQSDDPRATALLEELLEE
ncbi:MAG TPA: HEAT repeat domain-containing protein [Gemmatimonadales bacterium]